MGMTAVYALPSTPPLTMPSPFLYIGPTPHNKQYRSELNYGRMEFN